jgi:hypothetical protein
MRNINIDYVKSFIEKKNEFTIKQTQNNSEISKQNEISKILFDEFSKELDADKSESDLIADEIELKDKLNSANAIINNLIEKLNDTQISILSREKETSSKKIFNIEDEPLVIRPDSKTEGIFNDVNLTEDYELGMRFYQLGLKTGFFNVKLDGDKNSTRIATAEFFPNKFWPAVKQRSRWIAGICLQNWKAHKWNGNLRTKYFLFRDRKPLISFWSTFLSNVILLYFIYLGISSAFNIDNSLITGNIHPALWFLMIFNLFFMVSKGVHRFIFTSGWYGARYGFASIFRLAIDSFINFFAIIRSVSVYHKTKKKVVWDATTHY